MPATARTPHIAHVLYMDVVAYSKLPTDHQIELRERLRQIVRSIPDFQRVLESGSLILRDTGDGMALAFFGDLTAPVSWARHIARALQSEPGIPLRIGIHTGPVYLDTDLTAAQNLAGDGINMAQRVMDCGDAGHILVSRETAGGLSHISAWKSALHDLGEVEVKHGVRAHIFNVYAEGFGNPATPAKLAPAGRASGKPRPGSSKPLIAVLALIAAAAAGGYQWLNRRSAAAPPAHTANALPSTVLPTTATPPAPAPEPVVVPVAVKEGLPVRLTLVSEVPLDAPKGLTIRFQVSDDVRAGDEVVIRKGASATGEIVDAAKKKLLVIGARTTFSLVKVEAVDGHKLTLRATQAKPRDGISKRPFEPLDKKSKAAAAVPGAKYWAYLDGPATVSVRK